MSLTTILPLYSWPTLPSWSSLASSIEANPDLKFTVIVNPNSGPETTQYPNSDYVAGMAQLNSYNNTELYGYVHTAWGHNSMADLKTNVTRYAGWKYYTGADIHVDGIFYDEAPADYSEGNYTYMSELTAFAHSSSLEKIIFNPGRVANTQYYALADIIVAWEDVYSRYSSSVLDTVPDEFLDKSAVLILEFTGSTTEQNAIVDDLKNKGVGGVYVSTENDYNAVSTVWKQFVKSVLAVTGSSGSSTDASNPSASSSTPTSTASPVATSSPAIDSGSDGSDDNNDNDDDDDSCEIEL